MRSESFKMSYPVFLLALLLTAGSASPAAAEVHVNVNIGPPPIAVAAPPEVVLVPNSSVYFVPGVAFDVFFYNGYWWSPRGDRWYRARAYNGPWRTVPRRGVPGPVYGVPRDYRQVYMHERHIPYGQWKKGRGEWRGHEGRPHGEGGYYGRGEGEGHHGRGEGEGHHERGGYGGEGRGHGEHHGRD